MKLTAVIFASILLAACATGSNFSMERAAQVKPGMTKEDVISLLGQPSHQTARVGDEVWTWANYNIATQQSRVATVIFVDGKVKATPEGNGVQ